MVVAVDAAAAAASAGLHAGDLIVEMNRRRVTSADGALEASRQNKGQRVLRRVWRDGGARYGVMDTSKNN